MTTINPYIEIENRLDPSDREIFMARVLRADPRLNGTQVADILSIYDNSDAMLGLREPFYSQNRDLFENVDQPLIRAAVIAAAVIRPDEMRPVVERLMLEPA